MKKIFGIMMAMVCGVIAFAQTKPTVVIVPFDSKGVDADEVEVLFEVFQSEFANTGVAKVVDRSSLDKIRKQQEFQTSDWSNADKVAELGKALNASLVVTGQLMDFKGQIVTTIKLIDVNTTEIVSSVVEKVSGTSALFDKLSGMAQELSKNAFKKQMKYKIGDTGPGGGIIFYVSEEGFNVYKGGGGVRKCNYFEMAKEDLGCLPWCPCYCVDSWGACKCETSESIGYGENNTYLIINGTHKTCNPSTSKYEKIACTVANCAAYACYNYKTETASDWFFPSKDELDLLYKNLAEKVLENSSSVWLMSSSECYGYDEINVWVQAFSDTLYYPNGRSCFEIKGGGQRFDFRFYSKKEETEKYKLAVRPIRAFAEE